MLAYTRQFDLDHLVFRLMNGVTGATLGALFYGGWGVFANAAHGVSMALRSGAAQGVMSFVVTLSGVTLMKWLFARPGPPWLRALYAFAGALGLIYAGIVGVHWFIGTPEILLTLAPGLPITILFCFIFTTTLMRLDRPSLGLVSVNRKDSSRAL